MDPIIFMVTVTRVMWVLGDTCYKRSRNSSSFASSDQLKLRNVSHILASVVPWSGGSHHPISC